MREQGDLSVKKLVSHTWKYDIYFTKRFKKTFKVLHLQTNWNQTENYEKSKVINTPNYEFC